MKPLDTLICIPKYLALNETASILNFLDDDLRSQWKQIAGEPLNADMVSRAENFIQTQTVDSILAPPLPIPEDVKEKMSDLSPAEFAKIAKADAQLGAALTNVLNTIQVAKMYSFLTEEEINDVTQMSLSFDMKDLNGLSKKLKDQVVDIASGRTKAANPFVSKTVDLIRELGPRKENQFYAALSQAQQADTILKAAQMYFPADLIYKIPLNLMREIMVSYPVAERSEVILAHENEEHRGLLLESFGTEGKLREMMDIQMNQANEDDELQKRVQRNQEEIWTTFVKRARQMIQAQLHEEDRSELINEWATQFGITAEAKMKPLKGMLLLLALSWALPSWAGNTNEFHIRTGYQSGTYQGQAQANGTYTSTTVFDVELEVHDEVRKSIAVRASMALDLNTSKTQYVYAGVGQRFYLGSAGVSTTIRDPDLNFVMKPKWRYHVGWDVGIAQVLVVEFGDLLNAYSTTLEFGPGGGAIYQWSDRFGIEGYMSYSQGFGFANVTTISQHLKFYFGLTYFY